MGRFDSSPHSAESSFRELDEVFLQNQTRIWLGEVLGTRLDEDLHISDLLQDGEILFEVSKVVWNLLVTKCMELKHLKLKYGPFGTKKSSGRYRPYSNVDSFLKICKILGMSGIDLFSPSDVVEKRDIRKVCICIRAFSKKAMSKQLNVPDFDVVIYSVPMPTEMVGEIRRSIESHQCTTSCSYNSYKDSQRRLKQTNVHDDCSSEESDEAESRYMGENSFSSTSNSEVDDAEVSSEQQESPEVYTSELRSTCDDVHVDSSSNVGERNYISDYLAFSDLMVHANDSSSSALVDGGNNMFDFFLNVDSQGGKMNDLGKVSDDEEMEASSTTSMTSILGRMLSFEFGDTSDADEYSSTNVYSTGHETGKPHGNLYMSPKVQKTEVFEASICSDITPRTSSVSVNDYPQSPYKWQSSMESPGGESCVTPENEFSQEKDKDVLFGNNKDSLLCEDMVNQITSDAQRTTRHEIEAEIASTTVENGKLDETGQNMDMPVKYTTETSKSQAPSSEKRGRKPFLKTVVKGTAIAGVLFLLLHIRKSSMGNANQTEKPTRAPVIKESKFAMKKEHKGSKGKGIYPAEKLKL